MLRGLWRSKVLGIGLSLGIAVVAAILVVENGRKASRSPAPASSDAWEVATDTPEEELGPQRQEVDIQADVASRIESRNPKKASSRTESKIPSGSAGTIPHAGGGNAPRTDGNHAPEAESGEPTNSADVHPGGNGVTFTQESVGVAINPGGDGGRQDSGNGNADDEDEEEDDEEEEMVGDEER